MDHEAFGVWFTDELRANEEKISQLLVHIEALENHKKFEHQVIGLEQCLTLSRDDVEITPLNDSEEEIPEETDFSEEGNCAQCGLVDFKAAVLAWYSFISK